jgi:hypothetical protein
MWNNFFAAGGMGMYLTALFGFLLVAGGVLHALRPDRGQLPLLACLALLTASSGLLAFALGLVKTFRYLQEVPAAEQVATAAAGGAESLNNVVLALLLLLAGALATLVGLVRARRATGAA